MRFLLDTCVISDFFKKNKGTIEAFKQYAPLDMAISSITVMEIEYGLIINPERALKIDPIWQAVLRQIQVLEYTQEDAKLSARIRSHLKSEGTHIGPFDLLLGGVALHKNLIFVTSNTREFERIPHLQLENWRS